MDLPFSRPNSRIDHRRYFSIHIVSVAFFHRHLTRLLFARVLLVTPLQFPRVVGPALPITPRQGPPVTPLGRIHLVTIWRIMPSPANR